MATVVQVCNLALLRVGQRQLIESLEEHTVEAVACRAVVEMARDAVLESHAWRFATRQAALARLLSVTRPGWAYTYSAPADCLRARYLQAATRNPGPQDLVPWAREDDAAVGAVILTDHASPVLVYTAKVALSERWSPLFVDALAWRVAMELVMALPSKAPLKLSLEKSYEAALMRAAALELSQGQADAPPEPDFLRVR